MNITQESIDDLNALLKVQINQDDYQEKVNAVIQNYRKQLAFLASVKERFL